MLLLQTQFLVATTTERGKFRLGEKGWLKRTCSLAEPEGAVPAIQCRVIHQEAFDVWEQPPQRRQNLKTLDVEIAPVIHGDCCQPFDVTQVCGSKAESAERQSALDGRECQQVDFVFDDEDTGVANGNARVTIKECAFYNTRVAVRAEDKIEQFKLIGLAFGSDVKARLERHNGKDLPGFENTGEREAPPLETLLMQGFTAK